MTPATPVRPATPVNCVALIGLMGSGKSTIGALLARRLGVDLVDVDTAIEARTGSTVRQLWEDGGEAAYRQLESDECLAAIDRGDVVLATPGGAVLDPVVRAALDRCRVVWLRADPTVLAGRVAPGDHRPLLGDDPLGVLSTMSHDRAEVYATLAELVVDTDGMDPSRAVTVIVDWLAGSDPTADRPL